MGKNMKALGKKLSPWSDAERAVLEPYKEAFRTADKAERKHLLENKILHEFLSLHPQVQGAERDILKRKVKEWYSNIARKNMRPQKWALLPEATFTKVLLHEKRDLIAAEAQKRTDLKPGDVGYLGHYRTARAQVTKELGEKGREEIQQKQKDWSEQGWPNERQQKEADRQGRQCTKNMDELRYKRMGMRTVTFAWYNNAQGAMGVEVYDNNATIGSRPVHGFETKFPQEAKAMMDTIWKYAVYVIEQEGGELPSTDIAMRQSGTGRRVLPTMIRSADGFPLLPEPSILEKILQYKKDLIRALLTESYELGCGRSNAQVPWKDVAENRTAWIDDHYWVTGITFSDPSHMKDNDLDKLITFYRERGCLAPNSVFRWSQVASGRRGMQTYSPADYTEIACETFNSVIKTTPTLAVSARQRPAEQSCTAVDIQQKDDARNPSQMITQNIQSSATFNILPDVDMGVNRAQDPVPVGAHGNIEQFGHLDGANPVCVPNQYHSYIAGPSFNPSAAEQVGFIPHPSHPNAQIPIHGPNSNFSPYPPPTSAGNHFETISSMDPPSHLLSSGPLAHARPQLPAFPMTWNPMTPALMQMFQSANIDVSNGFSPDALAAAAMLFQAMQPSPTPLAVNITVDPQLLMSLPAPGVNTFVEQTHSPLGTSDMLTGPSASGNRFTSPLPTYSVEAGNSGGADEMSWADNSMVVPSGSLLVNTGNHPREPENTIPGSTADGKKRKREVAPTSVNLTGEDADGRARRKVIPKIVPDYYERGVASNMGRYKFASAGPNAPPASSNKKPKSKAKLPSP